MYFLRQAMDKPSRVRRVVGYESARTIAVLFDAGKEEERALVLNMKKIMEKDGKTVKVLGYYGHGKRAETPEDSGWFLKMNRSDFGWRLQPQSDALKEFVKNPFHILVDLSSPDYLPPRMLAAMSAAHYKVSREDEYFLQIYDLTFKVGADCSNKDLIGHIFHYLKIIKTPSFHE